MADSIVNDISRRRTPNSLPVQSLRALNAMRALCADCPDIAFLSDQCPVCTFDRSTVGVGKFGNPGRTVVADSIVRYISRGCAPHAFPVQSFLAHDDTRFPAIVSGVELQRISIIRCGVGDDSPLQPYNRGCTLRADDVSGKHAAEVRRASCRSRIRCIGGICRVHGVRCICRRVRRSGA